MKTGKVYKSSKEFESAVERGEVNLEEGWNPNKSTSKDIVSNQSKNIHIKNTPFNKGEKITVDSQWLDNEFDKLINRKLL